jgi:hypothetical protein
MPHKSALSVHGTSSLDHTQIPKRVPVIVEAKTCACDCRSQNVCLRLYIPAHMCACDCRGQVLSTVGKLHFWTVLEGLPGCHAAQHCFAAPQAKTTSGMLGGSGMSAFKGSLHHMYHRTHALSPGASVQRCTAVTTPT